ncbi:hypothetical protein MexAM1_META1p4155 [Methylorubrum extorquens AM1]|uniref:Uncharacterized protein n=1 Tax=Methylorubrum extorquens (strain ATCC 14718 / DSM 1338 / JCM 2805 / NCIMB 9133 / AM1) TaxID=272630 RepID=C5B1Z0_METEA|nr:hypothetical protein MexAM1_META1p4155 [Methylorubrum extorquens AM1]
MSCIKPPGLASTLHIVMRASRHLFHDSVRQRAAPPAQPYGLSTHVPEMHRQAGHFWKPVET